MNKSFKKQLAELAWYMHKQCGANIYPYPSVKLNNAPQSGEQIYNSTGHYDPTAKVIVLFTHGRHPKDILRSFAHELYHHHQNLNGEMVMEKVGEGGSDPKYAQTNAHLRKLEMEAYMHGNIMFRDWTDNKKYKQ